MAAFTETYDTKNVGTDLTLTPAGSVNDGDGGNDYSVTFVPVSTGTIAPKSVTVTADNETKVYGAAMPAPMYTVNGSISPDTLTQNPTLSTTATPASQVGTYTIVPTGAAASSNYTLVYVPGTLSVTPATPTISWPTPAAIPYGTPLSNTQLDATVSVPGNFVYTPTARTVLVAGEQTLSVTFTPTDTRDYTAATDSTEISVVESLSLSKSTIAVLPSQVAPGGTATVTLTARDANGNQEPGGGLTVLFKISGKAGGKIGAVTDNKNGTYTATFTARTKAGSETITAKIGGQAVTSKATVTVVRGAVSPSKSTITVSPFPIALGGKTTVTLTKAAVSPAPAARSPGEASTNGLTIDAAFRTLLLDDSSVRGKPRPLFEP